MIAMPPRHAWLLAERLKRRPWLLVPALVVLVAAHILWFDLLASRGRLSAALVAGVVVMIAIKHVGVISPAYAALRRYFRHRG